MYSSFVILPQTKSTFTNSVYFLRFIGILLFRKVNSNGHNLTIYWHKGKLVVLHTNKFYTFSFQLWYVSVYICFYPKRFFSTVFNDLISVVFLWVVGEKLNRVRGRSTMSYNRVLMDLPLLSFCMRLSFQLV